ncbi:MAG: GldG family protein [Kiritimatiellaceae bacterium]|nr:GldG family protein [Kiritimatiellaceae bacterium]
MKRIVSNLNSVAGIFLALIVVNMLIFIALRNPLRVNWSGRNYYALSDKSVSLLDKLNKRVKVTVFFQDEHKFIRDGDLENLLEEYEYHSDGLIQVEWVDPARDRARTEMFKNKYGLSDADAQVVVFDLDGKKRIVRQADIADVQMVDGRREPVITSFKGEQAFSSAIHGLMQLDVPVVYFLVGHGERSTTNFEVIGYSKITTAIESDNVEVRELLLGAEKPVPDDAAVLVIAGPMKDMSAIEVEMIEDYLNRGGRVFVLLDALKDGGLEPMLRQWGVAIQADYVIDPDLMLSGRDLRVKEFNVHPISERLRTIVQLVLPRSVEAIHNETAEETDLDRPVVIPLMFTSEKGWSETQVEQASVKFNEETGDRMGPISLAVVVERGGAQKMLDVQIKPSRMVVIGDADFVSNGAMVAGNQDLFMSALNWLLDREELMAIAPKPIEDIKIILTQKQLRGQMILNVVGIPFIAMIAGLMMWLRRRK